MIQTKTAEKWRYTKFHHLDDKIDILTSIEGQVHPWKKLGFYGQTSLL